MARDIQMVLERWGRGWQITTRMLHGHLLLQVLKG